MREIQQHLVLLLKEIDEICIKNNIPYVLCGRTAKDACVSGGFIGSYVYASVIIPGSYFEKFTKLVEKEKKGSRSIESLRNNLEFPGGMAMNYVDETTTFIYGDSAHKYKSKGIYITIQKARNIPKNKYKAKFADAIDKVLAYADAPDLDGLSKHKQLPVKLARFAIKLFGKSRVYNYLMDVQDKLVREGSSFYAYTRKFKDNIVLSTGIFTSVKRVKFEGHYFFVPKDSDKFLQQVYGKKWATDKKANNVSARHLLVASTEVSYKDVDNQDEIYKNRHEIDRIINERKSLTNLIKGLKAKVESYWDYLFLTQARYDLYRKYIPIEDVLKEKYANGEKDWLCRVMADYIYDVKTYVGKKLPVKVSESLDTMVQELLFYTGEVSAAQTYQRLRNSVKLSAIKMVLAEDAREKSLLQLPKECKVEEDGIIKTYVDTGAERLELLVLDPEGNLMPFLREEKAELCYAAMINENQEPNRLVLRSGDSLVDFESIDFSEELVDVIHHNFARDILVARIARNGQIYVTAEYGNDRVVGEKEPEVLCEVNEGGEVPVGFVDEESREFYPLFCVENEAVSPVVRVDNNGVLWVIPDSAAALRYNDKDGNLCAPSFERFVDESETIVNEMVSEQMILEHSFKLVQKDVFGRIIEIAAVLDDMRILPLCSMDQSGKPKKITPKLKDAEPEVYSELCLIFADGKKVPVAKISSTGGVLQLAEGENGMPFGVQLR